MPPSDQLRRWFLRKQVSNLSFDDLWKIFLVRICDRAADYVDEGGERIKDGKRGPYFYDLERIADDDSIPTDRSDISKIIKYLVQQGFVEKAKRSPTKVAPTTNGNEKAIDLLNSEIFISLPEPNLWRLGVDEPITDWLLVHALTAGTDYRNNDRIDFRKVADHHPSRVTDAALKTALEDLERNDYVMMDVGPNKSKLWAYFNPAGMERARWLSETWSTGLFASASNRFVRIDHNSRSYEEAVARVEELIEEAKQIRVNDWPEKEGMIASLTGVLEAIQSRYVNKTSVLAAVSSVATFVATKFAEAPIAEIASRAWLAVKALF